VVTKREAARLRADGSLYVSFQGDGAGADNHSVDVSSRDAALAIEVAQLGTAPFEMLEAGAYWGAYRPVLAALQQAAVDGGELPMEESLLRCASCDTAPSYVAKGMASYDVRPIFNETDQTLSKTVDVTGHWEDAEGSSLDKYQLQAAKALLTRRLALVQGPPGTGKTFIGLMVVRTLLRNTALWSAEGMAAQAAALAMAEAAAAQAAAQAALAPRLALAEGRSAPAAGSTDRRMKAALDAAERMQKRAADRATAAGSGGAEGGKRAADAADDAPPAKTARTDGSSPAPAEPLAPLSLEGLTGKSLGAEEEEETSRETLLSPTAAAATGRPDDAQGWLKHRIQRQQKMDQDAAEQSASARAVGAAEAELSEAGDPSDYPSDVPDETAVRAVAKAAGAPSALSRAALAASAVSGEAAGKQSPPILVLCHTNHALDQFLEGILLFEPRVVRVGGRSQSETLKAYNLTALLTERRAERTHAEKSVMANVRQSDIITYLSTCHLSLSKYIYIYKYMSIYRYI